MEIEVINTIEKLKKYKTQWESLYIEHGTNVFHSPGWVFSWIKNFISAETLYVIFLVDNGKIVGVAPLMISENSGVKYLHHIGTPLNDRNSFLTANKNSDIKIIEYLYKNKESWDVFCCKLTSEKELGLYTPIDNFSIEIGSEPSPLIILPLSFEEYLSKLDKQVRYDYRRVNMYNPEFKVFTNLNDNQNLLDIFLRDRFNTWTERNKIQDLSEILISEEFSSFLRDLSKELPKTDSLFFTCLSLNGEVVATSLSFKVNERVLIYMKSWNYNYKKLGVGKIHDIFMIRYLIGDFYKIFDYGRGDEKYKFKLGSFNRKLYNLKITNITNITNREL